MTTLGEENYELAYVLPGHSRDIRGVACGFDGELGKDYFLSGSSDESVRIWMVGDGGFEQFQQWDGKSVSSICTIPQTEKYPRGVILCGHHDGSIHGYEIGKPDAVFKLTGHRGAVCSVDAEGDSLIVSGSWDKTAIIWKDLKMVAKFIGHQDTIWAVAFVPGDRKSVLTASGDCSIRIWTSSWVFNVLEGHTGPVRTLAVIDHEQFLSGSTDTIIRLWSISRRETTHTFSGHTNYIYCISLLLDGFVSVGEDHSARVWKERECVQVIPLPATASVWSVATMRNGDIVTGSSDGRIRIFTADNVRKAGPEVMQLYEDELHSSNGSFFPVNSFAKYDDAPNYDGIGKELLEGIQLIGEDAGLGAACVHGLLEIGTHGQQWKDEYDGIVEAFLKWPLDKVHPALDVLRWVVLNQNVARKLNAKFPLASTLLQRFLSKDHPKSQYMFLRMVANAFGALGDELMENQSAVLSQILATRNGSRKWESAAATVILNYSVVVRDQYSSQWATPETQIRVLKAAEELLGGYRDELAKEKTLVTIGNLLSGNPALMMSANEKIYHPFAELNRVQNCALQIKGYMRKFTRPLHTPEKEDGRGGAETSHQLQTPPPTSPHHLDALLQANNELPSTSATASRILNQPKVMQPSVTPRPEHPGRWTNRLAHYFFKVVLPYIEKNDEITGPFIKPVDPVELKIPTYFSIVKNPMDLTTIENRIRNRYYADAKECEDDFELMITNAKLFNPPTHPVFQAATMLRNKFNWHKKKTPYPEREISQLSIENIKSIDARKKQHRTSTRIIQRLQHEEVAAERTAPVSPHLPSTAKKLVLCLSRCSVSISPPLIKRVKREGEEDLR